jgi:hypothetical protein
MKLLVSSSVAPPRGNELTDEWGRVNLFSPVLDCPRLKPMGWGCGLKSGDASPERRVLFRFHFEIIVHFWLKVMLQILLDHRLRHLACRGTEALSCPEMLAPISLFQVQKLFKQLGRRPLHPCRARRGLSPPSKCVPCRAHEKKRPPKRSFKE